MKVQIDKYFLEEMCPFTQRRKVKWKSVKLVGFGTLALGIFALLAFSPSAQKNEVAEAHQSSGSNTKSESTTQQSRGGDDPFSSGRGSYSGSKGSRQYSASQVVKRGEGNGGDKLPMGSTIPAKLTNTVLSSDSNSPVIAEIADEIYWKNGIMIPSGTKAIGQGALDDTTERLQVRFHTLVFPEGDQHSLSALALLGDGSSGLAGDFHSRTFPKQAGRFFGTFVGGLAQGLKDKDSRGQAGIVFEPGSLKNGLLNGVATSSLDQANYLAQDTERLKPYLEVPGGTTFLLYLEHNYPMD